MSRLRIALFGEPQITHGGEWVSFRTRKALALLIYLVVEGGAHSREKLATLLWPESDPDASRATLRSTLRYLRDPLQHADDDLASHIEATREKLAFNFDSNYELDLDLIQNALKERSEAPATAGDRHRRLQLAADAQRGAFLEGFSLPDAAGFDDWMSLQREQWHLRMSDVFDGLSQAQSEAGETPAAVETATGWVAFEPLKEAAYRRLMRVQVARGDRAAALKTYERCRKTLAQELGVEPAAETRALAQRLETSREPVAGEGRREQSDGDEKDGGAGLTLPLVGRSEEHTRLVEAFYRAREGGAQVVLVEGEAGIGKTYLVQEFLSWVATHEARILQGRAFETGGRLPYHPLVEAIRPLGEESWETLSPPWLGALSVILPELGAQLASAPDHPDDAMLGRARLFEAVARLGMALAGEKPLVLFMDDVQWADAATLDLLNYVVRRWHEARTPALLVSAIRSETLHRLAPSETLRDWLHTMQREAEVVRLQLDVLDREETGRLVNSFIDADSHTAAEIKSFGDWLFRETGGQPFYVTEIIEALLEEGSLVARSDSPRRTSVAISSQAARAMSGAAPEASGGFVPPGVRDVVRNRLSRISPAAFELLAAGAVLGHEFDFRALCRVAGLARAEALSPLDSLLAAHLLVETQRDSRPYAFTHDKIRDVVYTEAGDGRRQLYHERALNILQEEQAPAAQLAHHAARAGDDHAVFEYSLQAGEEMMSVFAVRDALYQLRRAHGVLREQPRLATAIEHGKRRRLFEGLGRACELINEWDSAQAVYGEMLADAREADLPGMEVTALNRLATIELLWKLDPEAATALLEQALVVAEVHDDRRGLAETHWNRSLSGFYSFERGAALEHGEQAIVLAREVGDNELIAKSLNASGYAASGVNRWEKTEAYGAEAQHLYADLGNRALEVDSLLLVAFARINVGRTEDGVSDARRALGISRHIENQWGEANSLNHLTAGLLDLGRYGEALEAAQQALTLPQIKEAPHYMAAFTMRGLVYWACRDFQRALTDHLRAREHLQNLGNPGLSRVLSPHLCADYVALKQWDKAYEQARVAMETKDFAWYYAGLRYWTVLEALLQAGDEEAAAADVEQLEEAVGHVPRYQIIIARSKALFSRRRDDNKQTQALLSTALQIAQDLSLPGEQWPLLAELVTLAEEEGYEEKAGFLRHQADTILTSLAESIDDHHLRRALLDAAARDGMGSDPGAFSP